MRVSPSLIGLAFAAALSSVPSIAAEPQKAEVIHWWTSGGEAAAKASPMRDGETRILLPP